MTVPAVEEPLVTADDELPPLVPTGDDETDEELALLRATTQAIHAAQDRVAELSDERKRLVLDLRRRRRVLFRVIANAAGSTDQTIYKIHREALRDEADRADAADADRLGYPNLDAYRDARAQALVDGLPEVPVYEPPDVWIVDEDEDEDEDDEDEDDEDDDDEDDDELTEDPDDER